MPVGWAIAIVLLWLAVIGLAVMVLGVLRQITPVLERAAQVYGSDPATQGPQVGAELPAFGARDAATGELVAGSELRGRPVLLLFLSSGCGPCADLAREMSTEDLGALAGQLVVVTDPGGRESLGLPAGLRILTESANEASGPLQVSATPFALAVDPDGHVRAKQVPNTIEHLASIAAVLA